MYIFYFHAAIMDMGSQNLAAAKCREHRCFSGESRLCKEFRSIIEYLTKHGESEPLIS